jgi:hypothetical protein
MHKVVEKLIFRATLIQNIICFYFYNQEICFKTQELICQHWEKTTIDPFYFQQLYFSNKKVNEVKILCEDALGTNLRKF